jgi:hypothetical protein
MSDDKLQEIPIPLLHGAIPRRIVEFAEEAENRAKRIRCFDYVPSNYRSLYWTLASLPNGRYCEWGSGIGIGMGVAAMLGWQVMGIEMNEELVEASSVMLEAFDLPARVRCGSYFDIRHEADVYFVYCWPGKVLATESHFVASAPHRARLLICNAADDIRCKVRISAL